MVGTQRTIMYTSKEEQRGKGAKGQRNIEKCERNVVNSIYVS